MKIERILNELKFAVESAQITCSIPAATINSRIYVVGQVRENTPGIVLGEREPYLREKNIGSFIKELKSFGEEFQSNEFLIESSREINEETYEVRYYQLTHIEVNAGEVILKSELGELHSFRKLQKVPSFE